MATLTPLDDNGWLEDWRGASRQLRKLLASRLMQAGLTESRAAVLDGLRRHPGPCSQTELADDLNLSDSNLCGLVEKMQQEGLVTRSRSLLDRRKFVLALTEAGREREADVREIRLALRAEVQRQLPAGATTELDNILRSLVHALDLLEGNERDARRMAS
jgi:DNA-binding MarR family transcriptional regulator